MNKLTNEVQLLKKRIEDKARHPFLDRHIIKQEINEDKLALVTGIISNGTLTLNEKQETQIISVMLVQTALDIHELVPEKNSDLKTKDAQTQKELHVLAGDYYSGLYYYLLSQINDFAFIKILASAIKEINENKMLLHYEAYNSFEEYMNLKIKIDSLLINDISDYMNNSVLKSVIEEWLYIDLLQKVKDNKLQKNNLNEIQFRNLKNEHLNRFEYELNELPHSYKELQSYFSKKLNHLLYSQTKIAEEG